MKIVIIIILLLVTCMVASAGPVAVGGDFGRTWINNFLAQNHKTSVQNNSTNLTSWGGVPKGKALVNGNLVDKQNTTNPLNQSATWLGDATISGNPSSTTSGSFNESTQASLFLNKGIIKPIHGLDATWNKTLQGPQPDVNGLIHGLPAESYDAIGPALEYLSG